MKKFFALVLAVAMIMSMAAVSFATTGKEAKIEGPFDYDSDLDLMRSTGLQYGDTVYYLLCEENGTPMQKYEAVEKLKLNRRVIDGYGQILCDVVAEGCNG